MEKLRVRELDLYLNKHVLTSVGRKLHKANAIRCHYYRHNKEAVITIELSSDEDDVESEDEEFESEEAESDNDFVFVDLDEQSSPSATIQFISDAQVTAVSSCCSGSMRRKYHYGCHLHIKTVILRWLGEEGWGIMKPSTTDKGDL